MIKNIIFDWSGPIKDISESHFWVVKKMFEFLGEKEISIDEIKENYEEPYMKFWNKFFPDMTLEEEQILYKKTLNDPSCPQPTAYRDVVELVKKIKKNGKKMLVLSSDFAETLFPEMEKFGLNGFFEEVVPFVHDKSDTIHDLIKRNNFKIEETVFVGDSNNEIKAGKEAGVKTIAVTWGLFSEEKLKLTKPDCLVNNIQELEKILL